MRSSRAALLLVGTFCWSVPLTAQEQVLVAGSEGVPVPTKTRHVEPVCPPEAVARGVRGIVILDLVIDGRGHVVSAQVVRGVPGLDEAAIAAARQWQYEPVKVAGRTRSVSLTVPITFALDLPRLERMGGIPELRQGARPVYPEGASGNGSATVELTLEADGRVGATQVTEGAEPWTSALLTALKSWRFSEPAEDSVLSFRVEALFAAKGSAPGTVTLRASGLRRADLLSAAQPVAAATTATQPDRAPTAADPPKSGASAVAEPQGQAPPVEVVTAPTPAPPVENGISTLRDVSLEAGVPELARGRRPIVPPLARMSGATGTVVVAFSVGAAGTTLVKEVTGPDLLKKAAEEAVASWAFRRARADRVYLVATFTYAPDKATAVVRPQAPPETLPPASPPRP